MNDRVGRVGHATAKGAWAAAAALLQSHRIVFGHLAKNLCKVRRAMGHATQPMEAASRLEVLLQWVGFCLLAPTKNRGLTR